MSQEQPTPATAHEDTDLKAFLGRYLRTWPLVAVAGLVLLALVIFIMMTVAPIYSGSTSVVINTPMRYDDPSRLVQPRDPVARTDKNYYLNEQVRITSQPIVHSVVKQLNLGLQYVEERWPFDWDVYKNSPIVVELDTNSLRNPGRVPYGVPFYLHDVKGDKFTLVGDGTYGTDDLEIEVEKPGQFGEWIMLDSLRFRILRAGNSKLPLEGADASSYGFVVRDINVLTLEMMEGLLGEPGIAEATTVNVTFSGTPKQKVLDVLNAIGETYTSVHLAEQRSELGTAISSMEKEIAVATGQMNAAGKDLEQFKTSASITDLTHSTIMLQEEMRSVNAQRESLLVTANYYDNLASILKRSAETQPPSPKAYGITDPLLNDMTAEYTSLQSDVAMMKAENKTTNPQFIRLQRLLEQKRANMLVTVEGFQSNTRISLKNVDAQRDALLAKQSQVPGQDRVLVGIEREQRMLESAVNDMMSRLSGLKVQYAAVTPNVFVSAPAYLTDEEPFFPDIVILLAVAVLLALIYPIGLLIWKALFSDAVVGQQDLYNQLPGVTVAAQVPYTSNRTTAALIASTASQAHVEVAKLAALLEQGRTATPELLLVCGAGGKETAGTFAERLVWMLAQRGNKVLWAHGPGKVPQTTDAPATLAVVDGTKATLQSVLEQARSGEATFAIHTVASADAMAILPRVGEVDHALVICQPGITTKSDLKRVATTRGTGQLPDLMLVLDGTKDNPLPWFGLAKGRGEQRLGVFGFIRYNWNRALGR